MHDRHITHLIHRYISGQLTIAQRAQVVNHVRVCAACRAELARHEEIAGELQRTLPSLGYTPTNQLSDLWTGVWQDVSARRWRDRLPLATWLPGVTVAVVAMIVLAVAVPLLSGSDLRVEAAPIYNRPISTASPTPGSAETEEARHGVVDHPVDFSILPQATVAFLSEAAATPAPVPGVIVSPEARGGLGLH